MRSRSGPGLALVLALAALAALGACGGPDGPPPPSATPPAAPATDDPAFTVTRVRDWYLISNDLTPGQDQLYVEVAAPDGVEYVDAWVAGQPGVRLQRQPDGHFLQVFDLVDLGPGDYDVLLSADGADTGFARLTFHRSYPLYVIVSTDYDFSDPSDQALARMDSFHSQHTELRITHFVGPYTFTDPALTDERRQQIVDWLLAQRADHGDELGLHIHPYCNFVEAAGLTCITDQSVEFANGDPSGYTVEVDAYGEADFLTLLHKADELFQTWGLGKPLTFRAGAWTASIETLRALEADGFIADTSALNWAKVEEWDGVGNDVLWTWNMTHWAPIDDTSQPWYPNDDDILSDATPQLELLEVPDNGAMVDYVSIDEMTDILSHNWDGGPLAAPTVYSIGFHPSSSFGTAEALRVDGILDRLDESLADHDHGPVVYEVLHDMPLVFARLPD